MPTMGILGPGTWVQFAQDFVGQEQYNITPGESFDQSTQGARAAFTALMVAGVPFYIDPYFTEGELLLINHRYFSFYIHEAAAFAFTGFASTLPNFQLGYIGACVVVLEAIVVKLLLPPHATGMGKCGKITPVTMPEASVYEYYGCVFGKNHVWRAWQRSLVQTVAKSHGKEAPPHFQFELRVLGPNGRHHPASGLFADNVRHDFPSELAVPSPDRTPPWRSIYPDFAGHGTDGPALRSGRGLF